MSWPAVAICLYALALGLCAFDFWVVSRWRSEAREMLDEVRRLNDEFAEAVELMGDDRLDEAEAMARRWHHRVNGGAA